jgi:hypothetical protein
MSINPPNRVGMAQEILSRQIEGFKSRWQPKVVAPANDDSFHRTSCAARRRYSNPLRMRRA